ncbi:hypothetical protein [Streptomyces smyrnaeus]|uniref:hypothetical protein n=1 Tax=Streptomyces smyrnaeus TaxID=1387713 RepID=UPI0033CF9D77
MVHTPVKNLVRGITAALLLAAPVTVSQPADAQQSSSRAAWCADTIDPWKGSAYTGNLKPKEGSLIKVNIVINDKGDKAEIRVFASSWGETGVTLDKTLFPEVRGENEQAKWEMSMPSCNEKGLVASAGGYVKVKKNGKEYRGKMHRGY